MEKYKRYSGVCLFVLIFCLLAFGSYLLLTPKFQDLSTKKETLSKKEAALSTKEREKKIVEDKLKKLETSLATSQKKVYSPMESDLGDDTLFFTMYTDLLDMIRSNSVKIKSIDTVYNPKDDTFVSSGGGDYFVCNVNMELIANYVSLGKVIEQLYQYPYYLKIVELNVEPYIKDKKVLIAKLVVKLYAHTDPVEQ